MFNRRCLCIHPRQSLNQLSNFCVNSHLSILVAFGKQLEGGGELRTQLAEKLLLLTVANLFAEVVTLDIYLLG
jgi:hypothetical protein